MNIPGHIQQCIPSTNDICLICITINLVTSDNKSYVMFKCHKSNAYNIINNGSVYCHDKYNMLYSTKIFRYVKIHAQIIRYALVDITKIFRVKCR